MDMLAAAQAIKEDIIHNRRALHSVAEIGFELPQTVAYIMQRLREYGYEPRQTEKGGIICTVGRPGKTLLLRADMDALPMPEESGLPFASQNGYCHSCGHDCHAAMLLGAARLLKGLEAELPGTIKFMFQPAEEILSGAAHMIEAGVLENPVVDAALGLHVMTGAESCTSNSLRYTVGAMSSACDSVRIHIQGKEAHGARSYLGVDALTIAAHTLLALQAIVAREIPSSDECVVVVGKMYGGTSSNSLAGSATLEVTLRSTGPEQRAFIRKRTEEIALATAATFRGSARVEQVFGTEAMMINAPLAEKLAAFAQEILAPGAVGLMPRMGGSEDFSLVAARVPTAFFILGAGSPEEGFVQTGHHPAMRVNEEVLPTGTALYAHMAKRWLEAAQ